MARMAQTATRTTPSDTLGHRQRLRARLIDGGAEALADYEVLEVLLFAAKPRGDTKPLAKALIQQFGTFGAVLSATPEELQAVDGVGEAGSQRLLLFARPHVGWPPHRLPINRCCRHLTRCSTSVAFTSATRKPRSSTFCFSTPRTVCSSTSVRALGRWIKRRFMYVKSCDELFSLVRQT